MWQGLCSRGHAGHQDFKRLFVQRVSALSCLSAVTLPLVLYGSLSRGWAPTVMIEYDRAQKLMLGQKAHSFTSTHTAYIHRSHTEIGGSSSACSLAVDMLFYNCRVKPCWAHQSLQVHNQHSEPWDRAARLSFSAHNLYRR